MPITQQHVLLGAAAYGAAVYVGYSWVKKQQKVADVTGECDGSCAFDRLAPVYDDIIDSEESTMLYGWKRSSLLKHAQGDVLELSAGTGRNLPYFKYINITSLTLTDVSTGMLQQAQRKYFNDLQLQYKQPNVQCKFMLADAQNIVSPPGEQPHTVLLPPFKETNKQAANSKQAASKSSSGFFRLKSRNSSNSTSSSSSSSITDEGSGPADTAARQTQSAASTSAVTPPAASSSSSSNSSSNTDSTSSSSATGNKKGWGWSHLSAATLEQDSAATSSSSSSTFAPHSFDTVVDTFGLCSCDDPVGVLRQAALLVKPCGKVLLLEHGQGTWDWINNKINQSAARHYKTYGCWYNRDILGIVKEAGLHVESVSRPWSHFGTTYIIVASPQPEPATVATAA